MASSWANHSHQTNHLHETHRYHHPESHHPTQHPLPLPKFPFHRRAGPSQLSEQGPLHLENHLFKGEGNRRRWLVPGEEAFVSILKKPVPSGVAAQARLGEEYLVHPGSCPVPYLREKF